MKRIITIILAVVLIVGGLGGVAYAETANQVQLGFHADWGYKSPRDTFTNGTVTGERHWAAAILESGQLVTGTNLTLTSNLALDWFCPKPDIDPPTHHWFFDDVYNAKGSAGFTTPDVSFTPGFDASRSIVNNKTEFLQSEGTQTQTVDITVTPIDSTDIDIQVMVSPMVPGNDLVDAVITSPKTDETQGIRLSPNRHDLAIFPTGLERNQEVTGRTEWSAGMDNHPDETEGPVTALALTLDSTLEFDFIGHTF